MTKNKKSIHLVVPKDNEDIIRWKNALPPRSFNGFVNEILIAESKGAIGNIPCDFSYSKEVKEINGRIDLTDPAAINFVKKIKKGFATEKINCIIRKHIQANREKNRKATEICVKNVCDIMNGFKAKIKEKETDYFGVQDKHRKLCDSYELAIKTLFCAILGCCAAQDNLHANSALLHLGYEKTIDDAFNSVFGQSNTDVTITVPKKFDNKKQGGKICGL